MVYALTGDMAFSSAKHRDAVLADINATIATRTRWGTSRVQPTATSSAPHGILLELRFVTRADMSATRDRIVSHAKGQRLPLAGSVLISHDCRHDSSTPQPCSGVVTKVW